MNELSENEMTVALGGTAVAVQNWGAQMAETSLGYVNSSNPFTCAMGVLGADVGAAAYYGGWGWSSICSLFG